MQHGSVTAHYGWQLIHLTPFHQKALHTICDVQGKLHPPTTPGASGVRSLQKDKKTETRDTEYK